MKITFILPDIGLAGGVKVVFQYAKFLSAAGHEVSVVYSPPETSWASPNIWLRRLLNDYRNLKYLSSKAIKIIKAPRLSERDIPDADIIVATWWETAYNVSQYGESKGRKFYQIQHHEIWGGPKERVDKSYKLGLHNIVISSWLKKTLEDMGANVEALILNSVDFDEFYPEKTQRNDNETRVLIPYRDQEWKGITDGLEAVKIARRKFRNIKLVMFGPKTNKTELTRDAEFHVFPRGAKLRRVYNSCDIFLFPSHCEGFGLPPMEAMACRIPVVTTNVGAIADYAVAGRTAMVSEPRDINALADNLITLIEDGEKRKTIAENGYHYIKNFTWDASVKKLEDVFEKRLCACETING